jgi:hypothetical protein
MVTLPFGTDVRRARLLSEGLQHRRQGGRALWGQVASQPASPAERHIQAHAPVSEPVITIITIRAGGA